MPKRARPLTDREIRQRKTPGVLIDGGGLRLRIENRSSGDDAMAVSRRWTLRVTVKGLGVKEGGLGGYPTVSLAAARDIAADMRSLAKTGVDPFKARDAAIEADQAKAAADAARRVTFRDMCEEYLSAHASAWRNAKHAAQWKSTLAWACAFIGDRPVSEITTEDVLHVLQPIWKTKTETASRLRGRVERVFASAIARGLRPAPNPAAWRDNLAALLPAPRKVAPVKHHAALPYAQIPTFIAALEAMPGTGARALTFAILTAARSGEVRGMTWDEINLKTEVWTVPAERMKARREHRVPLSPPALLILKEAAAGAANAAEGALVFPGSHVGRADKTKPTPALSDMTLTAVLRRMAQADPPAAPAGLTAHGFRSTFRDWCGEQTSFPREVAEAALAHAVANKVEAAYARGDLFDKRRRLMQAWGEYCTSDTRLRE